jgi:hemerythrin-like domain-containing protein
VLERILLVYGEAARRIDAGEALDLVVLRDAAAIVRRFVEDYHERMEEQFVFPRFEAAGKLPELTAVLRKQHDIGRALTTQIQTLAAKSLDDAGKAELSTALRRFNHMYQAHAAREDTDLFPGIRALVGDKGYAELGELLEDKEHEILGKGGFEEALRKVADLEKDFGVSDLATL